MLLTDRVAHAFLSKAQAVTRAFGFDSYTLQQIALTSSPPQSFGQPQFRVAHALATGPSPIPVETGQMVMSMSASGSIVLQRK